MRDNKKGLSNIIATVLIVLLALAAIAIIWNFVRQPLEDTTTAVGLESACLLTEAKPTSCVITLRGFADPGEDIPVETVDVNVQLIKGEPSEVVAILTDGNGASATSARVDVSTMGALETVSANFVVADVSGLEQSGDTTLWTATVATVVADAGNELVCQESFVSLDCEVVVGS